MKPRIAKAVMGASLPLPVASSMCSISYKIRGFSVQFHRRTKEIVWSGKTMVNVPVPHRSLTGGFNSAYEHETSGE